MSATRWLGLILRRFKTRSASPWLSRVFSSEYSGEMMLATGRSGAGKADVPCLSCGSAAHAIAASESARATPPHPTTARLPPPLISTPTDRRPPLLPFPESDLRRERRSSVHTAAAPGHTCVED